jgi:hypothetical protein
MLAKPAAPPPARAEAPTRVNTIVGLKMAGITLILIGVAIIAYQLFFPSPSQAAAISHNILSGGNSGNTMTIWPSVLLFLLGGWLWKSGR